MWSESQLRFSYEKKWYCSYINFNASFCPEVVTYIIDVVLRMLKTLPFYELLCFIYLSLIYGVFQVKQNNITASKIWKKK